MNPASEILKNINNAGLITIASKAGEGKTALCNSMLYHYLLSGINVIFFSEFSNQQRFEHLCDVLQKEKDKNKNVGIGIFVDNFGIPGGNNHEIFKKVISHDLSFLKGQTVIIIDSDSFFNSEEDFDYCEMSENTRYVIFEKTDLKNIFKREEKLQRFVTSPLTEKFITKRKKVFFLRELIASLNLTVVFATNAYTGIDSDINGEIRIHLIINNHLMYGSDLIITSKKNREEKTFDLKIEKSRYSAYNQPIKCLFEKESHSFVTK